MTYNEFVKAPSRLRRRLLHKADEVALKWEICTKSTPSLTEKVQSSPENTSERTRISYIEAKRELDDMMAMYDKASDEVKTFLYDNLNMIDADILEWRYVDGKTVQEIADIMGVAYQTAKNRLSSADKKARSKFLKSVPKSTEKYLA